MAEAIVQSSIAKLRSAMGDARTMRLDITGDLQEMLELLVAIDAAIPNARDWWMLTDWAIDEWAIYAAIRTVPSTQDQYHGRREHDQEREDDQERGEVWLTMVKDISYMVCHMVDELQEMKEPAAAAAGNKMARMLTRPENAAIVVERKRREKEMLDKTKEIKEKLKGLRKESVQFDDVAERRALLQALPATVGRDEAVRSILDRLPLICGSPAIILIRGREQIGKGTVAAMVFDDHQFRFYSRIWINISPPTTTSKFCLREMGDYMVSQLETATEEDVRLYGSTPLHKLLNGKKVLLGLRNLCNDPGAWTALKDMLSVGTGMGSTQVIVIATVNTAQSSMSVHTYEQSQVVPTEVVGVEGYDLEPLSLDMCCTIIKQAALRSQHRSADQEDLEWVVPKVASLCGGLPMAAQIYGSLLQFKPYREWPQLLDLEAHSRRGNVGDSLELSYRSMPPNLKLCFSYCAFVFATQREIVKEVLIHQWIALDLIESSEAFTTTQLAEQYLRRLLDMSLLQPARSSGTSAKDDIHPISFTMHASVAQFEISSTHKDFWVLEDGATPRHSVLHCSYVSVPDLSFEGELKSIFQVQKIRALCCLGCSKMKLCDDSFSFATYLRVLELHKSFLQKLPESICQLKHLGYINLSGWSGLVTLPESIGNLINLLHIDLSSCSELVSFPGSFGKLTNLVHISLSGCSKLANLPGSFGKLMKLVHIDLSGCSALVHLPEFFGKLINLVHINLSGCLALVDLPGSLGKLKKLEHINLSGCPKLENLPDSSGKLINLVHINLSGCPGLVNLPSSFGKLTNLAHINLSGCSGLGELPQSFGKLTSLAHINLSGCPGLATLPGSFGDLQKLLHLDLSHCYGLSKLPESFVKLQKLVHLDLSFWYCFEGIKTALAGLTSLQHLNLSHPCCYRADYHHLQGLKEVLSQFIRLKHLNLSMFLNPIFCNQTEVENREYIEFISNFSRLEYLDLSHNIFLCDLPEGLAFLRKLHTLNLSGCIRLKKVGQWMADRPCSLRLVVLSNLESYKFEVGNTNPINSYNQLVDVKYKALEMTRLDLIKSGAETQRIRLARKEDLEKLKLSWGGSYEMRHGPVDDNVLLGELVPPHSLQHLELHGYMSRCFPSWLTSSSISSYNGLVEVILEDIKNCRDLPPLGLLPNLERVVIRRMENIRKIDVGDLSGAIGNRAAFLRLSNFTIDDMPGLQEFITTYKNSIDGEELLFTVNDVLEVHGCYNMRFVPFPARAKRLVLSKCDSAMDCFQNRAGVEGPSCFISSYPVTQVATTELEVEDCSEHLSNWCLLNHLPGLRSLRIKNCNNLICKPESDGAMRSAMDLSSLETLCFSSCDCMTTLPKHLGGLRSSLRELRIESCALFQDLPDGMEYLDSLEYMHVSDCNSMTTFPPELGDFTSLQRLTIERCTSISSLPSNISSLANLKDLRIIGCEALKKWCGRWDSKEKLDRIRPKFEETPTSDQFSELVQRPPLEILQGHLMLELE